jgi:hypothetical protein
MFKNFFKKNPDFSWKDFVNNNETMCKNNNLNNEKKVVLFLIKNKIYQRKFKKEEQLKEEQLKEEKKQKEIKNEIIIRSYFIDKSLNNNQLVNFNNDEWIYNNNENIKINLTVIIPFIDLENLIWISLESLRNQNINGFFWELIIIDKEKKLNEYIKEYINLLPNCKRIVYKSFNENEFVKKFNKIRNNSILNQINFILETKKNLSNLLVIQIPSIYSYVERLNNHYKDLSKNLCYISLIKKNYIYDKNRDNLYYNNLKNVYDNINSYFNIAFKISKLNSFNSKEKINNINCFIINEVKKKELSNTLNKNNKIENFLDKSFFNLDIYNLEFNNELELLSNYKITNYLLNKHYYIIDRLKNINKNICKKMINLNFNSSLKEFDSSLVNSLHLVNNHYDKSKSIVIWGGDIKNLDCDFLKKHESIIFLIWTGTDCYYEINSNTFLVRDFINKFYNNNIIHIAMSNSIFNRLNYLFPKNKIIKKTITFIQNYNEYKIKKNGDGVYIYMGISSYKKRIVYGFEMIKLIILSNKHLKFYICTNNNDYNLFLNLNTDKNNILDFLSRKNVIFNSYNKKDLINIYSKCFIGLRLTNNDGNANTIQELGLMGIRCIHIDNIFPNVITYKKNNKIWDINIDNDERIKISKKYVNGINLLIMNEKKEIGKVNYKIRNKMINFLNLNKGYLYDN